MQNHSFFRDLKFVIYWLSFLQFEIKQVYKGQISILERKDGNKNPTNLYIWQRKTAFLHALHVHFLIFWHFEDVLVLFMTWNDLFCSCVDDVRWWRKMFNSWLKTIICVIRVLRRPVVGQLLLLNNNSPSQDSSHSDDHCKLKYGTLGFKPFSLVSSYLWNAASNLILG